MTLGTEFNSPGRWRYSECGNALMPGAFTSQESVRRGITTLKMEAWTHWILEFCILSQELSWIIKCETTRKYFAVSVRLQ